MAGTPLRFSLLVSLYAIFCGIALWRAVTFQAFDLLTIGVFPVLAGLLLKTPWAKVVLITYVALQTLGFLAMSSTAVIAYLITPEDVKIEFMGYNIPIVPLAFSVLGLIVFQWWVALSQPTAHHLNLKKDN